MRWNIFLIKKIKYYVQTLNITFRQPQIQVEIDKPIGLKLRQSKASGGGLEVLCSTGNAAKVGIKTGDTIILTSSFFGDELWPSDKLGFTQSALEACPSPVVIVYVKGSNEIVRVKNLSPKTAPRRFGRKLTNEQKVLAARKQMRESDFFVCLCVRELVSIMCLYGSEVLILLINKNS